MLIITEQTLIALYVGMLAVFIALVSVYELKTTVPEPNVTPQTVEAFLYNVTGKPGFESTTDIDGNHYDYIKIGNLFWFDSDLRTTRFSNGDPIREIDSYGDWSSVWSPALSFIPKTYRQSEHDQDQITPILYNWFAVRDDRNICPAGWRVPSDSDWMDLERWLGVSEIELGRIYGRGSDVNAGGKLKSSGKKWRQPNIGATDEIGFRAVPVGMRHYNGTFVGYGTSAMYWSSSARDTNMLSPNRAWFRHIMHHKQYLSRYSTFKQTGMPVRCVTDVRE